MSEQQQQQFIVPPTMTLLRRAWDVDRFIVLGSVEKVVAVMFCQTFEQFKTGVKPAPQQSSSKAAAASATNSNNKDAEATNRAFMIEAARMESTLRSVAVPVSRFCTFYLVDTSLVHEFDIMYELHADEPFALLFFYRNRHIKVDVGTGNHNKINFAIDRDELIEVCQAVFTQAKAGNKPVVETGLQYADFADRGAN